MNYREDAILSRGIVDKTVLLLETLNRTDLTYALINLGKEVSREFGRFIEGGDISTTSLQVRNIFEMYLLSIHICSSKKALRAWLGQIQRDFSEMNNGFMKLIPTERPEHEELREVQENFDRNFEESDLVPKGGFNIRNLAEEYGHLKDYLAIHKLCSKLIHPTSLKINSYKELTEEDSYEIVLVNAGAFFAYKTGNKFKEIYHKYSA